MPSFHSNILLSILLFASVFLPSAAQSIVQLTDPHPLPTPSGPTSSSHYTAPTPHSAALRHRREPHKHAGHITPSPTPTETTVATLTTSIIPEWSPSLQAIHISIDTNLFLISHLQTSTPPASTSSKKRSGSDHKKRIISSNPPAAGSDPPPDTDVENCRRGCWGRGCIGGGDRWSPFGFAMRYELWGLLSRRWSRLYNLTRTRGSGWFVCEWFVWLLFVQPLHAQIFLGETNRFTPILLNFSISPLTARHNRRYRVQSSHTLAILEF